MGLALFNKNKKSTNDSKLIIIDLENIDFQQIDDKDLKIVEANVEKFETEVATLKEIIDKNDRELSSLNNLLANSEEINKKHDEHIKYVESKKNFRISIYAFTIIVCIGLTVANYFILKQNFHTTYQQEIEQKEKLIEEYRKMWDDK